MGRGLHGAAVEVGDHEVINGVSQADQKCRHDGRAELRQNDLEERLARGAAQIQGGIVQAAVQLAQLGADIKNNIRHIERNVRNQQGDPAEHAIFAANAHFLHDDEQQHEGNAGDDFRVDNRDITDVIDNQLCLAAHGVDADGGQGAQHRGNDSRNKCQYQ